MATTAEYRLGEFTFPRGWFMVADARELQDRPLAIRFFGRDMVLYRGKASGKATLLDAKCPHMGTNLAKNTTSYVVRDGTHIDGDGIRCPYHAWRFQSGGQCDEIPGLPRERIPKAACVRAWQIHESMGVIWVWHDEEGLAPEWEAPSLAEWVDPSWVHWEIDALGTLPVHGQEILDNIVDMAHFTPIHGQDAVEFFENEFQGHRAVQRMSGVHRTLVHTGQKLRTDTTYHGPGFLLSYMQGQYPSIILIANTPVEDGVTRAWHALLVKSPHPVATEADATNARAFQAMSRAAFAQDFEVWANKAPALTILQTEADGPFHLERLWYRQFFNPRSRRQDFLKRVEGVHLSVDLRPAQKAVNA